MNKPELNARMERWARKASAAYFEKAVKAFRKDPSGFNRLRLEQAARALQQILAPTAPEGAGDESLRNYVAEEAFREPYLNCTPEQRRRVDNICDALATPTAPEGAEEVGEGLREALEHILVQCFDELNGGNPASESEVAAWLALPANDAARTIVRRYVDDALALLATPTRT